MRWTADEYKSYQDRQAPVKQPKYRNVKKVVNGLEFDSTKEARRYQDLCTWQASGQITELERQRTFQITVNGEYIGFYVSDFCYRKAGQLVVEDVKSKATRTPLYRWKKKLIKAVHGIEIQEV